MKTIKNMGEFKETYFPIEALAEKAIKMTSSEFWGWYLKFPDGQQEKIREAMERIAKQHRKESDCILDLLGY